MYVSDEIDSMDETTFDGLPFIFACRRVSTKGEDVTTAVLLCFLYRCSVLQRRNE